MTSAFNPCLLCNRYTPSACNAMGVSVRKLEQCCDQVCCSACGAEQCHSNGGARGTCRVCYFGRLPGWSLMSHPSTCVYKGCTEPAVYAYLPGSKSDCCVKHGAAIIARQNARRAERRP